MVRATRIIEASASNVDSKEKNKIKSRISARIRKKEIDYRFRGKNKKQFLAEKRIYLRESMTRSVRRQCR